MLVFPFLTNKTNQTNQTNQLIAICHLAFELCHLAFLLVICYFASNLYPPTSNLITSSLELFLLTAALQDRSTAEPICRSTAAPGDSPLDTPNRFVIGGNAAYW